jgi:hypothetical protein
MNERTDSHMEPEIISAEDLAARVRRLESVVAALVSRSLVGNVDVVDELLTRIDAELARRSAEQGAAS